MGYLVLSFFLSYCHWSGPKVAAELRVESKSTSGTQSSPRLDPVDNDTDGDPLMAALGLDAIEAAIYRLLILAVEYDVQRGGITNCDTEPATISTSRVAVLFTCQGKISQRKKESFQSTWSFNLHTRGILALPEDAQREAGIHRK